MSSKPPTPQGISALLRKAGHERAGQPPDAPLTDGFRVTRHYGGGVRVVQVFWPEVTQPERFREKLDAYAEAITAAGWTVEAGEWELVITAGKDER